MTDQTEIISELLANVQAALERKNTVRAEAEVMAALAIDPNSAEALRILAGLKFLSGEDELAFGIYKSALGNDDLSDSQSLHGLASVMLRLGRRAEALPVLKRALSLDPENVPALYDLGMVYLNLGKFLKAIEAFIAVSYREPAHKGALINCAAAFVRLGSFRQAIAWYEQLLRHYPDDALAWSNAGLVYRLWGMLDQAQDCQMKALSLEPDSPAIHWNNANVLLSQGNYEDGFREYEWRLRRRQDVDPRQIDLPRWDGKDLSGETVFLSAEQGLGDIIQFSRFADAVSAKGGQPILELHPSLVPLLAAQPGRTVHVLGQPLPEADYTAPLMSLPGILKLGLDDLSNYPSNMRVPTPPPEGLPSHPNPLGFVWRGNKAHEFDMLRSFDLETMLDLIEHKDVTLVSLQADATAHEKDVLASRGILDAGSTLKSFLDTAQWMMSLSGVVCVDTAAVHLSASLGCPTLLLINRFRDWRWLTRREDSPWYPSLRILQPGIRGMETYKPRIQVEISKMVEGKPDLRD